jgi:hypothetical protein
MRPPLLRRYAFRIKARLPGSPDHARPYRDVIEPGKGIMSRYFRVAHVRDPGQYARLCTLEYLFDRYGIEA